MIGTGYKTQRDIDTTVAEYKRAYIEGNIRRTDDIWNANPMLWAQFDEVVANLILIGRAPV